MMEGDDEEAWNEDGWDDDDAFLDQVDEVTDEPSTPPHPQPPYVQPSTDSTLREHAPGIAMGQGLLLGRLSRFLEAVAQPEQHDHPPPSDPHQDNDDEHHQQPAATQQSSSLRQWIPTTGFHPPVLLSPASQKPQEEPPLSWEEQEAAWANEDVDFEGVDDDEGAVEQEHQPSLQRASSASEHITPSWNSLEEPRTPRSANRQGMLRSSYNGWEDELALEGIDQDDDHIDNNNSIPTGTGPPVLTSRQLGWEEDDDVLAAELEETGPMTATNLSDGGGGGGGWDEDEDDLEEALVTEEEEIVDHVPSDATPRTVRSVSVQSVPASTTLTETEFGPVLDHLPPPEELEKPFSAGMSVSVQCGNVEDILNDDDDDDDVVEDENGWDVDDVILEDEMDAVKEPIQEVDHVPAETADNQSVSTVSVPGDESTLATEKDEDLDKAAFGPVVDHLPESSTEGSGRLGTSGSMAVQAGDVATIENGWDEDDDILDVVEEEPAGEEVREVDHVPMETADTQSVSTKSVPGDQSTLATEKDEEPDKAAFGLMVDHLPESSTAEGSGRLGTGESMAVQAGDIATIENGWDDEDDDILEVVEEARPHFKLHAEDEFKEVDHVPTETADVQSVSTESVPGDGSSSESEKDDDPDKAVFGPVVDHLPERSTAEATGPRGTTESMAVQAGDAATIDNGWDEDDGILEACEDARTSPEVPAEEEFKEVDHVPTETEDVQSASTESVPGDEPTAVLEEDDDPDKTNFGPMVDRLPSEHLTPASQSASLIVQASPSELNRDEDVGECIEDGARDESERSEPLTKTGDAQERKESPKCVDHVPAESARNTRSTSTMSLQGDQSASVLDKDDDPDKGDFGPVVDHLPPQHLIREGDLSTAVQVSSQESHFSEDGRGAQGTPSGVQQVLPIVVDHVPNGDTGATPGNSTVLAVASQRSTVAEDAWENDFEPKSEDYGPVVDHTPPTPLASRSISRASPSIAVQAPIEEMEEEDDYDEDDFGLVVDHTPHFPPSTSISVTGSMAVQVAISEMDDDEDMDDRVNALPVADEQNDEYTRQDDDSSAAPPMPDASDKKEEPLVDHVPRPADLRPTDASTVVVVDPSEVSTVGDMTYEEQQYGPVVDHTPAASPSMQPSGYGSTMAAATTSECPDELEDDLDDTVEGGRNPQADDESESVGDDGTIPTVEGAPPPNETNVVDHVPPENDELRRIHSETTLTIGQSLVSRDETRISDFGPVVDHTPSEVPDARTSLTESMLVQVPPSELESNSQSEEEGTASTPQFGGKVVDHLPLSHGIRPEDSVRAVKSSESEDGTLEETLGAVLHRYVPVVDHLPFSSNNSLPTSFGGSTTGALATLSEVIDDDHGTDGWDDDQDLSQSTAPSRRTSEKEAPNTEEKRSLSVTFSSPIRIDETQYFDADRPSEAVYIDSQLRGASELLVDLESGRAPARCNACVEATTADCPCIQSILHSDDFSDGNSAVVTVKTEGGVPARVDFSKLLQHEITKRLLLERELEASKATIRSLEEKEVSSTTEIDRLHMNLVEELESEQKESASLRAEKEELSKRLTSAMEVISELEASKDQLTAVEQNLEAEIEKLRDEWASKEQEYLAKTDELRSANEQLDADFERMSSTLVALEDENRQQKNELASKADTLSELNQKQADWETRESSLATEIQELRAAKEKSASAAETAIVARDRISTLEVQVAAKAVELEELKSHLAQVNQRLKKSEGENFAHMKETSRLAKHHELEKAGLLKQLETLDAEKKNADEKLNAAQNEAEKQLKQKHAELEALQREHFALQETNDKVRKDYENVSRQHRLSMQEKMVEVRRLDERLKAAEHEKNELRAKISTLEAMTRNAHTLESQLANLTDEYNTMQTKLCAREETIRSLQKRLDTMESSRSAQIDDSEALVTALSHERNQLQAHLERREEELDDIRSRLDSAEQEKIASQQELEASKKSCQELEASMGAMKLNALKLEAKIVHSEEAVQSVQKELKSAHGSVMKDRTRLQAKCTELEKLVSQLRAAETDKASALAQSEVTLNATRDELEDAKQRIVDLVAVEEKWKQKCQDLQSSMSRIKDESAQQIQSRLSDLESQMTSMTKERDELRRQLDEKNHILEQRTNHSKLAESALLDAKNALADEQAALAALQEERSGIQQHDRAAISENESLVAKNIELEQDLSRAHDELRSLRESLMEHEEKERQLNGDLDLLISEREALLQEREALEEDGEEMLVQLGLSKQQLDAHEAEIEQLRVALEEKAAATHDLEARLQNAEQVVRQLQAPEAPRQNGSHHGMKSDVQRRLDDAEAVNSQLRQQVQVLEREKNEILERLGDFESRSLVESSKAESKEQEYKARIHTLEERCHQLDGISSKQQLELDHLTARLQSCARPSELSENQIVALQQQVAHLEAACADRDGALRERDVALEELRLELSTRSSHLNHGERVQELVGKLQRSEEAVAEHSDRIAGLEEELERTRQSLRLTEEKLSNAEVALLDMELDMDVRDQGASEREDLEARLREMEEQLKVKTREAEQWCIQARELESEMATRQQVTSGSTSMNQEHALLQSQLQSLQQEYQSAAAHHKMREDAAREEIETLTDSITEKREQIAGLEEQLQALSVELSSCQEELVSKETEYRRVSMELEESRSRQLHSTQQATSQVLDVSSKEEAESIERMRTHIISLAMALEKSERQRADAMDRLLKDRQVHADSLRRLGESVKRFYSTLSCAEV